MVRSSNRFLDVTSNGHVSTQYPHSSSLIDYTKTLNSISTFTLLDPPSSATCREESTRIQLQRQRLKAQHSNALVSNSIPGFKTSAAFFASLRTNLRLNASPPASPMSTPPSMRGSTTSLPPPSPLTAAADLNDGSEVASTLEDPLAGVPELSSYQATTEEDKTAALKLVADSVAQMRQNMNMLLIWHPLNLAVLVAVLSLIAKVMQMNGKDLIAIGMACIGGMMIYFAAFRILTQKYITAAEDMSYSWIGDADVFVTKFGDEIIGTVIVDWLTGEGKKRKKAARGEIKGWAVRLRYRGKGVGSALLEDAVKQAKSKSVESIEFAADHANSLRVLPAFYNKTLDRREAKSAALLQELFDSGRNKRK